VFMGLGGRMTIYQEEWEQRTISGGRSVTIRTRPNRRTGASGPPTTPPPLNLASKSQLLAAGPDCPQEASTATTKMVCAASRFGTP